MYDARVSRRYKCTDFGACCRTEKKGGGEWRAIEVIGCKAAGNVPNLQNPIFSLVSHPVPPQAHVSAIEASSLVDILFLTAPYDQIYTG